MAMLVQSSEAPVKAKNRIAAGTATDLTEPCKLTLDQATFAAI